MYVSVFERIYVCVCTYKAVLRCDTFLTITNTHTYSAFCMHALDTADMYAWRMCVRAHICIYKYAFMCAHVHMAHVTHALP